MLHLAADAINIVTKAAPILGSMLGGPLGGIIGSIIASATGVSPTAPELEKALSSNSDIENILTELEAKYAPWLKGISNISAPSKIDLHLILEFPNGTTVQS